MSDDVLAFRFETFDAGEPLPDDQATEVAVASVVDSGRGSAAIRAVVPPKGAAAVRALALRACVELMESLPPSDPTAMPEMPATLAVRMIRVTDRTPATVRSVADVVYEPTRTLCGYDPDLTAAQIAGLRLMAARIADELEATGR